MCAAFKGIQKILIIDDDIDLLMLLERRLSKEGYYIESAASLPQAEEILNNYTPHLVLLDINVKGEDGRKLCWKLKMTEVTSLTRVILMSGFDFNTNRAVLFGADELLPKPFNLEYLVHRIKFHLDQQRADGLYQIQATRKN